MAKLEFFNNSKALVVKINEEIDHHTCEKIRDKIDLAIEFRGARRLIFDFDGVNFMDSSGIGMILGRYNQVTKYGGQIYFSQLSEPTRRLFELSGLLRLISTKEVSACV